MCWRERERKEGWEGGAHEGFEEQVYYKAYLF